jgi:hypothetical protein
VNVFQSLLPKSKGLLKKLVEKIESLSNNKRNSFRKVQKQVDKVEGKLEKILNEGCENQDVCSNFYCFFYAKSRSKDVAFSKVVSFNVLTEVETTICKGNRFRNASISCRINEQLIFIYLKSSESGSFLVDLSEEILNPEQRKKNVSSSKYNHYNSAFSLLQKDEIGFFGSEERKSEAFNFRSLVWRSLSDFPFNTKQPSGVFFNEKVWILDFSLKSITTYSQIKDSFESFDSGSLKENSQKLVFVVNDELFVYTEESLLKYDGSDFFCVRKKVKMKKYEKIIAFPVVYKSRVYFLTNYRKVVSLEV